MAAHRNAEKYDGETEGGVGDEQRCGKQGRGNTQYDAARTTEGQAFPDQKSAAPASAETARGAESVRNPREVADRFYIEVATFAEISGKPEQEEVPGGIGQEFRQQKRPGVPAAEEMSPAVGRRHDRGALEGVSGNAVQLPPEREPYEARQ